MPVPIIGTISGSLSGSILGQNEYQTPVDAWLYLMEMMYPGFAEKNGYEFEKFEGNASTDFGHAFESSTIALTEQKLGKEISARENVFEKTLYPSMNNLKDPMFMSCHVDGIIHNGESDGWTTLYEGKTAFDMGFRKKWDVEKNMIPRSYNLQGQHNMYLADLEEAIFGVLVFPKHPQDLMDEGWEVDEYTEDMYHLLKRDKPDGVVQLRIDPLEWATILNQMGYHHIFKIERNDELIKTMLEKYQEFWTEYVIPKKPPTAMNFDDIKKLCPSPHGTVVLDPIKEKNIIDWINEYRGINKEIGKGGNLAKRQSTLKTSVMEYIKNMPSIQDEESTNKIEIKDGQGFTIASYSKQKDGKRVFRVSK